MPCWLLLGQRVPMFQILPKTLKQKELPINWITSQKSQILKLKRHQHQIRKKETAGASEAVEKASKESTETSGRIFISPLAKKMAEERGIDISQISGSAENGRIVKRDIENYKPKASTSSSVGKFVPTGEEDFDEVKHSQMRKVIAKRLAESKFTAPHYYLNVEFDMENAIAFRTQYNSLPDTKISFNDIRGGRNKQPETTKGLKFIFFSFFKKKKKF